MVVFIPFYPNGKDSRTFCILRAYLTAVSTTLLTSSFLLQALSRLFHTVFPMNRRCLLTWKFHYFLIAVQWMMGFLTPITILINHENIIYRTGIFCTIGLDHIFHLYYLYLTEYFIPVLIILVIYIIIVYRVNYYSTSSQQHRPNPVREGKLLKNILIFIGIFTGGGLPSIIYTCLMAPKRILSIHFFILTLVSIPLAVAIEKLYVLWLNTPLRHAFINCCWCVDKKRKKKSMQMFSKKRTSTQTKKTMINHSISDLECDLTL
ncbi:unnamed protein product [Adineta steineri]|uniref:G-protein coupled receptors family 1 profile domain-containing protein n=1 Tax=Adineta steineri TaxID=433720 RepID=A0A818NZX9_9BILA|nr:unnamed protein product [Adineta steineri]CAF3614483.1 unnamed protein product [Adineta steineri]